MRALSVRDFRAALSEIIKNGEDVMVLFRGKPVGIYRPLSKDEMRKERENLARSLVSIGKSQGGNFSKRHDEEIYG